jgi:hypothetical protein
VQRVEQMVGAGVPAGPLHLGVQHHGAQVIRRWFSWPTGDLDVPEAVEGEPRLPDLSRIAAQV